MIAYYLFVMYDICGRVRISKLGWGVIITMFIFWFHGLFFLPRPRRGLRGIVFTRSVCLSVCLSVCVCVCPANILVFYFSAIRRDIDLKFMQDIDRVALNSLKTLTFIGQWSRSQRRYIAF